MKFRRQVLAETKKRNQKHNNKAQIKLAAKPKPIALSSLPLLSNLGSTPPTHTQVHCSHSNQGTETIPTVDLLRMCV